jgi:hypothetical protein
MRYSDNLIQAVKANHDLVTAAQNVYQKGSSKMEKSGAIRKLVPWSIICNAIFSKS